MRTAKEKLFEMIDPTLSREYGGGLDDTYMSLSQQRNSAFAAPDSNNAFDRPVDSMPMPSSGGLDDTYMSLSQRRNALPMMSREQGGGLKSIPRERMISDQPHQLSYINEEEAGLLKALGGSGRKVDGIPAYYGDWSGAGDGGDPGTDGPGADGPGADGDTSMGGANSQEGTGYTSGPDLAGFAADVADVSGPSEAEQEERWRQVYSNLPPKPDDDYFNPYRESAVTNVRDLTWTPDGLQWLSDAKDLRSKSGMAPDENFTLDRGTIQQGIDKGIYAGIGIKTANALENLGLATFGKDMRGPYEAFTSGKGLYRYSDKDSKAAGRDDFLYDPETLTGSGVGTGPAAIFRQYITQVNAPKGTTISQVADAYERDNPGMKAPTGAFGFDRDSNALISEIDESMTSRGLSGLLQGIGLMATLGAGPMGAINFVNQLGSSYKGGGKPGSIQAQTPMGKGIDSLQSYLGLSTEEEEEEIEDNEYSLYDRGPMDVYAVNLDPKVEDYLTDVPVAQKSSEKSPGFMDWLGAIDNPISTLNPGSGFNLGSLFGLPSITPSISNFRTEDEVAASTPWFADQEDPTFVQTIGKFLDAIYSGPYKAAYTDKMSGQGSNEPERKKRYEIINSPQSTVEKLPVTEGLVTAGLSNREKSLGPQIRRLINGGMSEEDAIRSVGITQDNLTTAEILQELNLSLV